MNFEKVVSFYHKALKHGYSPFFSPALEKVQAVQDESKFLLDRRGNLYSIREDFTKSVLNHRKRYSPDLPIKVWYADFVYRYSDGDLVAEYQIGLEKIPRQDIVDTLQIMEIILESTSESFTGPLIVEIGHTNVYEDLLKKIPKSLQERVLNIIDTKNLAEIDFLSKMERIDLSQAERIIEASIYRRALKDLQKMEIPFSVKTELLTVATHIEKNFQQFTVEIDLALARTIEEYSGIIFTVYDIPSSKIVAAGGEYLVNGEKGVGACIYLEGRPC